MQYKYVTCTLPSNGLIYPIKEVHLRPKTIFDIKTLLGDPVFTLKSEIDALQNCINPNDNINVYDLVNQDVVYLLYKLRSMSDDILNVIVKDKNYAVELSKLEIKPLTEWNTQYELPDSKIHVELTYTPIKNLFFINDQKEAFEKKYPDFRGDVINTLTILNSIAMFDDVTDKDHIRARLETLSFKDSLYLLKQIDKLKSSNFGIVEEFELEDGTKVPLQITEEFFRPTL